MAAAEKPSGGARRKFLRARVLACRWLRYCSPSCFCPAPASTTAIRKGAPARSATKFGSRIAIGMSRRTGMLPARNATETC